MENKKIYDELADEISEKLETIPGVFLRRTSRSRCVLMN
jgi:hypothetical protein